MLAMFAFQRQDPRREVGKALEAAERHLGMFAGGGAVERGSTDHANRCYDLAFGLHEMHENVAAHRLTTAQHLKALQLVELVWPVLLEDFCDLAPVDRLEDGMRGLALLLSAASGGSFAYAHLQRAHLDVCWLQHRSHDVYLNWRRARLPSPHASALGPPLPDSIARVVPLFPREPRADKKE